LNGKTCYFILIFRKYPRRKADYMAAPENASLGNFVMTWIKVWKKHCLN